MSIPPSQTLYVHNLTEKTKKTELKKSLYLLFSQHGRILDIVAKKTPKDRGQAFIVFAHIHQATSALRALQGFPFYSNIMVLVADAENRLCKDEI